jgi:hypothetical protein
MLKLPTQRPLKKKASSKTQSWAEDFLTSPNSLV